MRRGFPKKLLLRVVALLVINGVFARFASADWQDSFETPQKTWRLADHDAPTLRILDHQRTFSEAHSGQACEYVRITADHATKIYFELAVPPGPVIDELSISAWVKATRADLQLLATVLLPRSIDPRTGEAQRVLLRGTSYQNVGQWQQLTIAEPAQLLNGQLASLRHEFGPQVDLREARLENVIINAYGGRGEAEVWIDDVALDSYVILDSGDRSVQDFHSSSVPDVTVQGSRFLIEERPVFLRIIEHNGEPFAWLKQLGFNTIRLAQPPTESDLEQARQSGVWLIAPPPNDRDQSQLVATSPLLAWDLGEGLTEESIDAIRSAAVELRPANKTLPLLTCTPRQSIHVYARTVDFLMFGLPGAGASLDLTVLPQHIRSWVNDTASTGPFVVAIDSQPPQSLRGQWQAMGFPEGESVSIEPEQLRWMVATAVGSGARGVLFRSSVRLDADVPVTRLRAAMLEWINQDLKWIEAWTCGGRCEGRVNLDHPRVVGFSLDEKLAQLLIVARSAPEQQHAIDGYLDERMTIVAPTSSSSVRAYGLSLAGAQPLRTQRVAGGLSIELEHLGPVGYVLLTNETLVVDHIAQLIAESRERRVALLQEILRLRLAMTDEVQRSLPRTAVSGPRPYLLDAATHLQRAGELAGQGDYRAFESFTDKADNALATQRRLSWEESARRFTSPTASPCCALYDSLPFHWRLAQRLRGRSWSGNVMPVGDMEDMQQLLANGWRRTTNTDDPSRCRAQLSFDRPHAGRAALLLELDQSGPSLRATADAAPLVISSPGVPVRTGQLIQIRGWVRAEQTDPSSPGVLVIYDSLSGPELGEIVSQSDTWREWTLYRAPLTDGQLIVNFALVGPGRAWIDDVSVEQVELR